ncbi:MAG: MBOAT family O-acyltransferase [Aquabacterium sp.]|nr:MBOAT family O-acyltransferase [Aquabacterium sp.]
MGTLAGFLVPYVVAAAAFPVLLRSGRFLWVVTCGTCVLIVSSPWLVPADTPLVRFIASISAAVVAIKFIDASKDVQFGRPPTWRGFADFLAHPFTHVRRSLVQERRPSRRESLLTVLAASTTCALATALLLVLFRVDWSEVPFLVEHASKAVALMLTITAALGAAAALWRLGGGTARDYMDKPFTAKTPAEFWRRYNRNVHQFFWQDVFDGRRSRRAPIRSILLVFALSAVLHEFIFLAAIGEVQGYQTAFFLLQGLAAASTARLKVQGWRVIPWTAGTLVFNLLSSVLFFASLHQVAPIYAQGLPPWLR